MTLYELRVTTSAQQPESDAVTDTIEVEELVLSNALIFLDEGSNGEVHAQLRHGEGRIMPHHNADFVSKPGQSGPVPTSTVLPGVPTPVELRAWAPNADFEHAVIAQFTATEPGITTTTTTRTTGVSPGP